MTTGSVSNNFMPPFSFERGTFLFCKNLPTFACIFLLVVPQVSTVGPSSGNRNSSKADRSEGSGSSSLVTPVVIAVVVVMVAIILILVLVYLRRKRLLMVKTGGKRCELR